MEKRLKKLCTSYPLVKHSLNTGHIHISTKQIYILYRNIRSQQYIYTDLFTYTHDSVYNFLLIHRSISINESYVTRNILNFREIYTRFLILDKEKGETRLKKESSVICFRLLSYPLPYPQVHRLRRLQNRKLLISRRLRCSVTLI